MLLYKTIEKVHLLVFCEYKIVARYVQDTSKVRPRNIEDTSKQAGRNRKTIQKADKRFDGSSSKIL